MDDNRIPLGKDTVIYENGTEKIKVNSKIGMGGTSLVYEGFRYSGEGYSQKEYVLIKEIYPYNFSVERDMNNGALIINNRGRREKYDLYVGELEKEVLHYNSLAGGVNEARNDDYFCRSRFISSDESTNGNCYVVMDTVNGETLDSIIAKEITFTQMCIYIISLLNTVERLHAIESPNALGKAAHLDISPDNIHISEAGMVRLIDFNTSALYDENGKGREYYPSKKGYSAPELSGDKEEVDSQADLYSIAACFSKMITGIVLNENSDENAINLAIEKSNRCKNVNPAALHKSVKLLKKGLLSDKDKRYKSCEEMKKDLEKIHEASTKKVFLRDSRMHITEPSYCFGRDKMVNNMHDVLTGWDKGNGHLYLSGIGGCGKSTLIYLYLQKYGHLYDTVHIADYTDFGEDMSKSAVEPQKYTKLQQLITRMDFNGIDNNMDTDKIYHDKLNALKQCSENTLIIIENYNVPSDNFCEQFLKNAKFKVIFCTRCFFEERLEIDYLMAEDVSEEDAYSFFSRIYNNQEEDTVKAIIEKTGRNFLSMKLIALLLENYRGEISADTVLKKLLNCKPLEDKIDVDFKCEVTPEAVLKEVFDISDLKEDECDILSQMTLIPYSGIQKETFVKMCGKSAMTVNRLIKLGWITKKGNIICLHQTVSDLLYRLDRTKPDWDKLDGFVDELCDKMDISHSNERGCDYLVIVKNEKEVEYISNRIIGLTPACMKLYCLICTGYEIIHKHQKAIDLLLRIDEKNALPDNQKARLLAIIGQMHLIYSIQWCDLFELYVDLIAFIINTVNSNQVPKPLGKEKIPKNEYVNFTQKGLQKYLNKFGNELLCQYLILKKPSKRLRCNCVEQIIENWQKWALWAKIKLDLYLNMEPTTIYLEKFRTNYQLAKEYFKRAHIFPKNFYNDIIDMENEILNKIRCLDEHKEISDYLGLDTSIAQSTYVALGDAYRNIHRFSFTAHKYYQKAKKTAIYTDWETIEQFASDKGPTMIVYQYEFERVKLDSIERFDENRNELANLIYHYIRQIRRRK